MNIYIPNFGSDNCKASYTKRQIIVVFGPEAARQLDTAVRGLNNGNGIRVGWTLAYATGTLHTSHQIRL